MKECGQCGKPCNVKICGECEIANRYEQEIDKLSQERDAARRILCALYSYARYKPKNSGIAREDILNWIGTPTWMTEAEVKNPKKRSTTKELIKEQQKAHFTKQAAVAEQDEGQRLFQKFMIEEFLRDAYLYRGVCLFWAESLSENEGLGVRQQVIEHLVELEREKRLERVAVIRGPEGHLCWQGPFAKLEEVRDAFRCHECGFVVETSIEEDGGEVSDHFQLSGPWKLALYKKKSDG